MLRHLALISELQGPNAISSAALMKAAAALQTQVLRDVAPLWGCLATVDAFDTLEDMPLTHWPVMVRDDIGVNAAGIHLDQDGRPFGLVQYSAGWELTTSHEVLEMLVDPYGNRTAPGPSIKPDQGPVEYLVEVCDPSEDVDYAYDVNGVVVSDFYTPSFFDPVACSSVRYSFVGAITKPREVLPGGYLSWRDVATNQWWQQTYFGNAPEFIPLGQMTEGYRSFRSFVDRSAIRSKAESPRGGRAVPAHRVMAAASGAKKSHDEAQRDRAKRLRVEIDAMKNPG